MYLSLATPTRPWFPGASYHITNRGNRKEIIFLDDEDYNIYLSFVRNTLEFYKNFNYKLLCYCLMSNHVHLLLKTDSKNPSFFMRRLNSLYVKYFNSKYNYVGHLFQERYFSNIITSEFELIEVSRYIHLNPVKANIVKNATDYKWSSYNHIIYNKPIPTNHPYLHYNEILEIINVYMTIEKNTPDEIILKDITSKTSSNTMNFFSIRAKYKKFVDSVNPLNHIDIAKHNIHNKLPFHHRVNLSLLKLTNTDHKIIEYIKLNVEKIINQSIQKTSEELLLAPNSIVRLSKKLGYNNFSDMKLSLKKEFKQQ